MKQKEWVANFEANVPEGHPLLTVGWPDIEGDITWEAYKEHCEAAVQDMDDGDDAPNLQIFDDWKFEQREKQNDELGFCHETCNICHALPGDRHAVTAWDSDMNKYVPLSVCGDCLQYIANSEVPDWLENE